MWVFFLISCYLDSIGKRLLQVGFDKRIGRCHSDFLAQRGSEIDFAVYLKDVLMDGGVGETGEAAFSADIDCLGLVCFRFLENRV